MKILQGNKVLYSNDRIICSEKGVSFNQVYALTQTYIGTVNILKAIPTINLNQNKFNDSIEFDLFGLKLSPVELFNLHNASAKSQGLNTYTKLFYDPKNATTFSPNKVSDELTNKSINKLNK